jgi:hypothetical protein
MKLTLNRLSYPDGYTPGKLHIGEQVFDTIERARTGDHPCIPPGEYTLKPHTSPHQGEVYSFIGDGVYEWEVPAGKKGRCLVLLHSANKASQLLGCVAPGIGTGYIDNEHAVLSSQTAMAAISTLLGRTESHQITVTEP